jgi:hypothetical protein
VEESGVKYAAVTGDFGGVKNNLGSSGLRTLGLCWVCPLPAESRVVNTFHYFNADGLSLIMLRWVNRLFKTMRMAPTS